jgi:hypothetical protein
MRIYTKSEVFPAFGIKFSPNYSEKETEETKELVEKIIRDTDREIEEDLRKPQFSTLQLTQEK